MAKKMYYSEQEAAEVVRCTVEQLTEYARQGKLQQYQDGAKRVYRADQVDEFAKQVMLDDTGEIQLSPADTATREVSLQEADLSKDTGKEDTVITAEGVSIFDDEDLDIEAADPMAKTQIAPPLEDQVSADGVGSGSGLLDLTRESDDTSLGAEVLTNIDMESGMGTAVQAEAPQAEEAEAIAPAVIEAPVMVQAIDPGAGLFSGLVVGSAIVSILLGVVALSAMAGRASGLVEAMQNNMMIVVAAVALLIAAAGVVGLILGKSIATKQIAMRSMGG